MGKRESLLSRCFVLRSFGLTLLAAQGFTDRVVEAPQPRVWPKGEWARQEYAAPIVRWWPAHLIVQTVQPTGLSFSSALPAELTRRYSVLFAKELSEGS